MKPLLFGLLMTTVLACGSSSDSANDNDPLTPATGQTLTSDFLPSDQNAFTAKIVWNNPPVSQSFANSAEVYFRDANGQPVRSSRIHRFHLYMATMGHPSIKEGDMIMQEVEPGHWSVSRIFFSMGGSAGSWVVDLDATVNERMDHIRVSIDHEVE